MPLDEEFLQAFVKVYIIILPKLSVKEAKEWNQDLLIKLNQVFLGVKTYHNGFTVSVMTLFMRFSSLQNDSLRESVCKKIQSRNAKTFWHKIDRNSDFWALQPLTSQITAPTHPHTALPTCITAHVIH